MRMGGTDLQTPEQQLRAVLTQSDALFVDPEGWLRIEDVPASRLLEEFGSPLFVYSEATLRSNYRRIRQAFADCWPDAPVNIMYAIKANTLLALRAILHQEGAGGDCFSEGELYATFNAGADPATIALNGGFKSPGSLRFAVEHGITVNIDAASEIGQLQQICKSLGQPVKVNIRMKPLNEAFNSIRTDYFGGTRLADYLRRVKWGFSVEAATGLVEQIRRAPGLQLAGLSFHVGRASRDVELQRQYGFAVGRIVKELHRATGFAPEILDIGGGWARERDPESRTLMLNPVSIEALAGAACSEILSQLGEAGLPVPALWVEPGRYIVGNAAVLLTTIGTIKHDLDITWVNIDAGSNDLPRIDTSGSAYHVLAASGMRRPADQVVDVVGPICSDSLVGRDILMPDLKPGDPLAILDAGMYSESAATRFNSIPRPAAVLVNGSGVDLIRERERIEDLFRHHRVPRRLQSA